MRNLYYLFSVKDVYFTDLSKILSNKKIFDAFYGLAYAKNPILNNLIYKNVSYVTDVTKKDGEVDYLFLESIENTYDVNISSLIYVDRHLSKYNKKKRLFVAQELMKLFIKEIDDFKITHVFLEAVDDFISFFAAVYCKHHGIPCFHSAELGYAARSCLTSSFYPEPNDFQKFFNETLHLIKEDKIDITSTAEEVNQYVKAKKKPGYYVGVNEADYRALKIKDIKVFLQYCFACIRDRNALPYEKNPLLLPLYRLVKIARKLRYKNFLAKEAITLNDLNKTNYLIYPLHFEPESSTLVAGRWFNDQRRIIEMIAKNLPVNTVLVVKEHRISIGRREFKFYKDIAQHHNVFFVDDTVDTYKLIDNSKGVIVISSTMGLEALLLKKPVMSFGTRFYNVSNNVYIVENFRTLDKQIKSMLAHKFDLTNAMALFHTMLTATTNLGNLSHFEYTQKDLEVLSVAIARKYS